VREVRSNAKGCTYFSFTKVGYLLHFCIVQSVGEDNGLGERVYPFVCVVVDGFLDKLYGVPVAMTYAVEELRKFFIKLLEESLGCIGDRKGYSQISAIHIGPIFQS